MLEKKTFVEPKLEVCAFEENDIIQTSTYDPLHILDHDGIKLYDDHF